MNRTLSGERLIKHGICGACSNQFTSDNRPSEWHGLAVCQTCYEGGYTNYKRKARKNKI